MAEATAELPEGAFVSQTVLDPVDPVDPIERMLRSAGRFARALLRTWQSWLTETNRDGVEMSGAWHSQWHALVVHLRDPRTHWQTRDGTAIAATAAFGIRALAFGLLTATAVLLAAEQPLRAGIGAAFAELVWAAGRYAILALLLTPRPLRRRRLVAAYLAGLAPYLFGVTPGLRLVSLVASGWLTYRGLRGAGLAAKPARSAIAWAFGGQLALTLLLGFGAGVALLTGP